MLPQETEILEDIILPRGCGHIVKIKRNTERPYCARRYMYTDERGNAHSKDIGYYRTRAEAARALLDNISKTSYDLANMAKSFSDIYNLWYQNAESTLNPDTLRVYRASYGKCAVLYQKAYCEVGTLDMQRIISKETSAVNQRRLRNLFQKMDRLADSMDIIEKRRSDFLTVARAKKMETRMPFSDSEIYRMLPHINEPDVAFVLFFIYTGLRNAELCNLKKEDVNLTQFTVTGGVKTHAGERRIIPVHERLKPYLLSLMNSPGEYLFTTPHGNKLYSQYVKDHFNAGCAPYCDRHHIPHEGRHTLRTRLDAMHADRLCIDLIMGHEPSNVGDRVYAHRTVDDLRSAINLLW